MLYWTFNHSVSSQLVLLLLQKSFRHLMEVRCRLVTAQHIITPAKLNRKVQTSVSCSLFSATSLILAPRSSSAFMACEAAPRAAAVWSLLPVRANPAPPGEDEEPFIMRNNVEVGLRGKLAAAAAAASSLARCSYKQK